MFRHATLSLLRSVSVCLGYVFGTRAPLARGQRPLPATGGPLRLLLWPRARLLCFCLWYVLALIAALDFILRPRRLVSLALCYALVAAFLAPLVTANSRSPPVNAHLKEAPLLQGQTQNPGMPPLPPRPPRYQQRRPPTKEEREAPVDHLEINPSGEVTIRSGDYQLFLAVARDRDGNIVHGVAAEWSSSDPQVLSIEKNGEAAAKRVGIARVIANAATKSASVRVTITASTASAEGERRVDESDASTVSSLRKGARQKTPRMKRHDAESARALLHAHGNSSAGAAVVPIDPEGRTQSTYDGANIIGTPRGKTTRGASVPSPATEGTETPGSSNYTFGIPLVGLPGRGIDVGLSLVHNSRLWNKYWDGLDTHIDFKRRIGEVA